MNATNGHRAFELIDHGSAVVGAALHDGHHMRQEVLQRIKLSEAERLREEDPFTGAIVRSVTSTHLIGLRSRFEVDLNRPRDQAVYQTPAEAWGLDLWKGKLPRELVERSLAGYDDFYYTLADLLERLVAEHRQVVILDVHSYNHRRLGTDGALAPLAENPEVNIGTGSLQRNYWGELVDRFIGDLQRFDYGGRRLDVRENVRFQGGHMSRWIHGRYPGKACTIAIEFKKFFMNEWTGQADPEQIQALIMALRSTLPGIATSLRRMKAVAAG